MSSIKHLLSCSDDDNVFVEYLRINIVPGICQQQVDSLLHTNDSDSHNAFYLAICYSRCIKLYKDACKAILENFVFISWNGI